MTTAPRSPSRGSTTITRTAVLALPAGAVRDRYRQELLAELYGLSEREQARHALGVLSRVLVLRAAVTRGGDTKEEKMRRPLRCLLGRHAYRSVSTEDGSRYRRCSRCGHDHPGATSSGAGSMMNPGF